jgi:hypothetical protein
LDALSSSLNIKYMDCQPKCIAHALFEANMFDTHHCMLCKASSDPEMWCDTLYRVYFAELYKYVEEKQTSSSSSFFAKTTTSKTKGATVPPAHTFANVLRSLLNDGPGKSCPDSDLSKCPGRCKVQRYVRLVAKPSQCDNRFRLEMCVTQSI